MKILILILFFGIVHAIFAMPSHRRISKTTRCNCNCPHVYKPVCARDAKRNDKDTFPSVCALECYNCTHEYNYRITKCAESRRRYRKH